MFPRSFEQLIETDYRSAQALLATGWLLLAVAQKGNSLIYALGLPKRSA